MLALIAGGFQAFAIDWPGFGSELKVGFRA